MTRSKVLFFRFATCVGIAGVLVTGCAGADNPVDAIPPASTPSPATTSDAPAPVEAVPDAPLEGPVLLACTADAVEVFTLDGDQLLREHAITTAGFDMTFGCVGSVAWRGLISGQQFDSQYSRAAVNFPYSEDGSQRVGWIDKSGEFVDVSAMLTDSGSFSSSVARHGFALFDPRTDEFVFYDYDDGSMKWVNSGFQVTRSEPIDLTNNGPYFGLDGEINDGFNSPWQRDNRTDCAPIVSPSGTQTFVSSTAAPAIGPLGDASFIQLRDNRLEVVDSDPLGTLWRNLSPESQVFPCAKAGVPITPETDYGLGLGIVAPDGSEVLFSAVRGDESTLFTVPTDGSAEPRKIDVDVSGLSFVDWLG